MRQKNRKLLLRIFVITFIGISPITRGQQNSNLVLNGKVLTPAAQTNSTTVTAQVKPAATNTVTPSQAKTTTTAQAKPTTTATQAKPAVAKAAVPVQVKPVAPRPVTPPVVVKTNPVPNAQPVDYIKRVLFVHNLVCKRIPQKLIDSIADVNHYMLDTIRMEIAKHKDKDSISFLQTALNNGMNDSLTLININLLVNSANGGVVSQSTGAINAYCIDLTTQSPMDSVKVSVYNHDSLIATAYSGNDGFCKITGLKADEYSLGFFKNNYTPFSDRWVKVTSDNVTYLEMPLTETPRFYLPRFSAQIWAIILVGIVSVFILIYSIIRRLGRVA